jgi:hypothetical protein
MIKKIIATMAFEFRNLGDGFEASFCYTKK